MRLSSIDIRKQEFKKILRGFDPVEVEAFLEMVADEHDMVQKSNTELKEKVAGLEQRVRDYENVEADLKKTLTDARYSADASKVSSRKEADIVLKEAEFKAERLTDESRREIARLKGEIHTLQSHKKQLSGRLRQLLSSQLELIKILELEDTDVEILKTRETPGSTGAGTSPQPVRQAPKMSRAEAPKPAVRRQSRPADITGSRAAPVQAPKPAEPEVSRQPEKPEGKEQKAEARPPAGAPERTDDADVPGELKKAKQKLDTDDLIDRMILEHERREDASKKTDSESESDTGGRDV